LGAEILISRANTHGGVITALQMWEVFGRQNNSTPFEMKKPAEAGLSLVISVIGWEIIGRNTSNCSKRRYLRRIQNRSCCSWVLVGMG
jgi:hypothetical protein